MGRIKSTAIKTLARDLVKQYAEKFTEDFEKNKEVLDEVKPIQSKKIRNTVAGYITTKMQQIKKSGL